MDALTNALLAAHLKREGGLSQDTVQKAINDSDIDVSPIEPVPPLPEESFKKPSKAGFYGSLGVMGAGQLADVLSTKAVLDKGGVELNPLFGKKPSVGRMLGVKAPVYAGIAYLLNKLHDKGQTKLAKGLALASGGIGFGLAAHNYRQSKK